MQVGEKDLSFAQKRELRLQWLFDFHDQVGPFKDLSRRIDNFRASLAILFIGITRPDAGILLHQHSMPASLQLLRRRWQ